MNQTAKELLAKIESHTAQVGVIGLGYVGLPLALTFTERGFRVLGFDVDPDKVEKLNRGESYIKHLDETRLKKATGNLRSDKNIEAAMTARENADLKSVMNCDVNPKTKNQELKTSDESDGCDEKPKLA